MTKGKNLNPADAYRKAQRKKELKKNKTGRQKARDLALVKKDTTELEDQIKALEEASNPSAADKSQLAELKSELEKISKKKEDYVKEHPDQKHLVYRRKKTEEEKAREKIVPEQRNVFNKKGLPRHPERSIYYHPVMNPYGVPPPGMPYAERPLLPGEIDSDRDEGEDDVTMPEGPLPGPNEELIHSDEDIPMPDGPPLGQDSFVPPLPPPLPQLAASGLPLVPPPPPPPPGFPAIIHPYMAPVLGLPPPGYPHGFPNFPPTGAPALPSLAPPPGFFPRRNQSTSSIQDPLSSVPHTTYQAHRASRTPLPSHPSLPPKPVTTISTPATAAAAAAAATISAEPELRDLKKEATSFVPAALKRKRPTVPAPPSTKIDAAPALTGPGEEEAREPKPAPPDLVSRLKDQFGPPPPSGAKTAANKKKDDYEKFMEEMGDILGDGS